MLAVMPQFFYGLKNISQGFMLVSFLKPSFRLGVHLAANSFKVETSMLR
jgi:hypothetical protein